MCAHALSECVSARASEGLLAGGSPVGAPAGAHRCLGVWPAIHWQPVRQFVPVLIPLDVHIALNYVGSYSLGLVYVSLSIFALCGGC